MPEDANLLGSPIGDLQSVDACIKEKIELLYLMGDRLEHFNPMMPSLKDVTLLHYLR